MSNQPGRIIAVVSKVPPVQMEVHTLTTFKEYSNIYKFEHQRYYDKLDI